MVVLRQVSAQTNGVDAKESRFYFEHDMPKFNRQRIVFAIVAFEEMAPMFFSNYAAMFLTMTGLAVQLPRPNPYSWLAVAHARPL